MCLPLQGEAVSWYHGVGVWRGPRSWGRGHCSPLWVGTWSVALVVQVCHGWPPLTRAEPRGQAALGCAAQAGGVALVEGATAWQPSSQQAIIFGGFQSL